MLEEAESSVKNFGRWRRSYDYDGQGVFHKTSVEITAIKDPKDTFVLGLNAAYVGKEVEDGLAAHLGIEQGLQWKSAKIQVEPDKDSIKIDFDRVLEKLNKIRLEKRTGAISKVANILNLIGLTEGLPSLYREDRRIEEPHPLSGKDVLNYFMATDEHGSSPEPLVIGTEGNVELILSLGVGRRFEYDHGKRSDSKWAGKGSILTVPVPTDYDDKKLVPYLNVTAQAVSENKYNKLPLVTPESKQIAEGLITAVSQAFQA